MKNIVIEKKSVNVHDGHRKRLRDRYIKEGLTNFSDHQVLELLLYYCFPRKDTNEIAHQYLEAYGNSLAMLFEADYSDIVKTLDVSENVAVLLTLIPHLSQKYMSSKLETRRKIRTVKDAVEHCVPLFSGRKYETFIVICLDTSKRLIASTVITEGSIDEAHVYPRKVVEVAFRFQASNVILAHNHPGGTLRPSFSDIEITKRISEVLSIMGIAVIDHLIVCGDQCFSFAKEHLLD